MKLKKAAVTALAVIMLLGAFPVQAFAMPAYPVAQAHPARIGVYGIVIPHHDRLPSQFPESFGHGRKEVVIVRSDDQNALHRFRRRKARNLRGKMKNQAVKPFRTAVQRSSDGEISSESDTFRTGTYLTRRRCRQT